MAKNSITDYDNIAANNTDIQSVDIDEGCAPSGINNAIRELMADLADVNDGTVPLASPDINGGTIDGVTIGGSTPAAISGTTGTFNGDVSYDGRLLALSTASDGTAAAPSIPVGYDYDNGFFRPTSNTIGVTTGGTERMRIDSSGNVGIGTNSPLGRLHSKVGSSGVTVLNSGADDLVLEGAANTGLSVLSPNTSLGLIYFADPQNSQAGAIQYSHAEDSMRFRANGLEFMRIDSSGNVGIGTSSPDTTLTVNGSSKVYSISKSNSITHSVTSTSAYAQTITLDDIGLSFDNNSNSRGYRFSNNGNERMRLTSTGNLSVGSTGNSGKLFVNQTSSSIPTVFCYANNASYATVSHRNRCARTGSSGYFFYFGESGNGSDTEFYVRGDGTVRADGTIAGGGADYAEMFEWDDGNSSNEDRRGCSVVLTSGNKIRKATTNDAATDIIGIVSGTAMLIGDAEPMKWLGKYNRDDYGSEIWETYTLTEWTEPAVTDDNEEVTKEAVEHSYETDKIPSNVTVPSDAVVSSADADGNALKRRQINPSYDDTQTYTPREERQEWDAVGMMGKLRMRSGQPTGDRWIKMRDIATDDNGNVTVEEWLVR